MNKFNIGDIVYAMARKRGNYEPSYCHIGEKMEVISVAKRGDMYIYICGYDGYEFKENEIMSAKEYAKEILKNEK